MTDHHFVDRESLERWFDDHESLWVAPLFLLLFVIIGVVIYNSCAHSDIFLLKSSIPVASAEW
jgi:hypothetical protein